MLDLTAMIFVLTGGVLLGGGTEKVLLGGSPYYVIAGLALLATAILLFNKKSLAFHVHATLLLASLAWAAIEPGSDWWQLGARGGLLVVLGLWLLAPFIQRPIKRYDVAARSFVCVAPLALAVAASIVTTCYAMSQDPHDLTQNPTLTRPQPASGPTALYRTDSGTPWIARRSVVR